MPPHYRLDNSQGRCRRRPVRRNRQERHKVKRGWWGQVLGLGLLTAASSWGLGRQVDLEALHRQLAGQVLDFTHNHGQDRRIWSSALGQFRDLYVYLPPGFRPDRCYPVVLWLHGLGEDERSFLSTGLPLVDAAIAHGQLPPLLLAIPDGNVADTRRCLIPRHSAFLNTLAGPYEDYLYDDVWSFVRRQFPVCPERQAHWVGGVSIGGAAAYHLAIKHREEFAGAFGIFPPLNFRWVDCHGNYFGNFNPCCWGWRTSVANGHETVGKYYGIIRIPLRKVVYPLYGRGPEVIARLQADNPLEMLDQYDVRPGDLQLFVAYGGRDEFNLDAQIESFLYRARQRGLEVAVRYDPWGHHNRRTALRFAPDLIAWLAQQLSSPSAAVVPGGPPP
jgi:pimeloyl-ACP methyl ester carboxylesterase